MACTIASFNIQLDSWRIWFTEPFCEILLAWHVVLEAKKQRETSPLSRKYLLPYSTLPHIQKLQVMNWVYCRTIQQNLDGLTCSLEVKKQPEKLYHCHKNSTSIFNIAISSKAPSPFLAHILLGVAVSAPLRVASPWTSSESLLNVNFEQ